MAIDRQTWPASIDSVSLAIRVLVVEDDPLDAELMLDQIRDDGIDVSAEVVADKEAYCHALRQFQPDIVLSDLSLPGFSGEQALAFLREHDQRTPFVFVSGTIGEAAAIEALRGGATDYVMKTSMARLPSAVRRAVAEAAERRALDTAESELIKAQRFETLAILAGSLGHDLRNILQPVLMATQLIEVKARDPEITRLCSMIRDCSDQGLELVSAMLALARGGQGSTGNRIKLAALLDAIALLIKPSLHKSIDLAMGKVDLALEIPGNSNELQQCLLNLAMNAAQAMPDGGRLELSAEPFEPDDAFFLDGEPRSGTAYVRISVVDSGQGMDAATLTKLFTPFFTTKQTGNGLGLVSCRRLVENHRGVIRVNSETGKGSRFDLYLPVHVEEGNAPADTVDASDAFNGHGEHVLVVSADVRASADIDDILELYGYVPRLAVDTASALALVQEDTAFQAALIDRDLLSNGDSGIVARLRAASFEGAVILFGATGANPVAVPGGHAAAHLSKPVTAPALLQALRESLARAPRRVPA